MVGGGRSCASLARPRQWRCGEGKEGARRAGGHWPLKGEGVSVQVGIGVVWCMRLPCDRVAAWCGASAVTAVPAEQSGGLGVADVCVRVHACEVWHAPKSKAHAKAHGAIVATWKDPAVWRGAARAWQWRASWRRHLACFSAASSQTHA